MPDATELTITAETEVTDDLTSATLTAVAASDGAAATEAVTEVPKDTEERLVPARPAKRSRDDGDLGGTQRRISAAAAPIMAAATLCGSATLGGSSVYVVPPNSWLRSVPPRRSNAMRLSDQT